MSHTLMAVATTPEPLVSEAFLWALVVVCPLAFPVAAAIVNAIDAVLDWFYRAPDALEPVARDYSDRITKPWPPTQAGGRRVETIEVGR